MATRTSQSTCKGYPEYPNSMQYLHVENLRKIEPKSFQTAEPFPWINPPNLLTDTGFTELMETMPDVSLFEKKFGKPRSFGQASHDRFVLEYSPQLSIPHPWKEFIRELSSDVYRNFLKNLMGVRSLDIHFHWHYTPKGCSVSPHCDAKHKLGSHIFYLNTEENWDAAWGGDTLILDDGGRFNRSSAPEFQDFDRSISAKSLGNYSLLFGRKANSWHGVRPLTCPENYLRKVFIVVINRNNLGDRVKQMFGKSVPSY